jgi:Domain of unknown function (DUF4394)
MQKSIRSIGACLLILSFFLFGCDKQDNMEGGDIKFPPNVTIVNFHAIDNQNNLLKFSGLRNFKETRAVPVKGLMSGERLLAIDIRPATGELYAVTSQSRLYVIDPMSGMANPISASAFTPAIDGEAVAFDFNPTVDRIRLVTSKGQNLRLHPVTGVVAAVDGMINPGMPMVVGAGYTNSFAGATTTTLYTIDVVSDKLFTQVPPNNGTLVEVGALGIDAMGEGGFDISPDNAISLAVMNTKGDGKTVFSAGSKYTFYYIDLATGKSYPAGNTGRKIQGISLTN